jgi:hypothetical protein
MQDTTTQSELHSIHSSEDLPSEAPLTEASSPVTRLWETSSPISRIAVTVIGTCLLIVILLYVFSRDRSGAEQQ